MAKNYLTLFWLSLTSLIIFGAIFVCIIIFIKKIVSTKKYGFFILAGILLFLMCFSCRLFVLCCKDYQYFSNNTYIEVTGTVVEFTDAKRDYDGNGQIIYNKPKFYFHENNQYVVLYAKNVELGQTYRVRYYPNTKICEVFDN